MTLSDLAKPQFYTSLLGVLAPPRHGDPAARRRAARLDDPQGPDAADFEDTRPCRWLLTEPPSPARPDEPHCRND